MQCFDENLLLELGEGTLQDDVLTEVQQHLDGCGSCRQAVAEVLRSDVDDVDGAPNYPALQHVDPAHYVLAGELARGGMGRIRGVTVVRMTKMVHVFIPALHTAAPQKGVQAISRG